MNYFDFQKLQQLNEKLHGYKNHLINKQFLFSRIREDVAACLVSRLKFTNNSIKSTFENKDLVIVGNTYSCNIL